MNIKYTIYFAVLILNAFNAAAMEQTKMEMTPEQARNKAVLEIFKRVVLVVDADQAWAVFKNLQQTAKIGTDKEFVVPYLKALYIKNHYKLREINDSLYEVSKVVKKERKDKKYEKYYARQQEALYISPHCSDTWSNFTPGKMIGTNHLSRAELEEQELEAKQDNLENQKHFFEKKLKELGVTERSILNWIIYPTKE